MSLGARAESTAVAQPKFTLPRLPGTVPRRRLFRACDQALATMRALWIHGPAGSGKTRLVSAYGERQAGAVRWFNADQGDRDPVSLFHGLATLSGACDLPDFAREQPFDLDNFTRRFFRAWFQVAPAGTILVLDDWHAVAGSLVEAIVPALIDQIPDGCALIVLSRAAPDPALARHVLNDRLGRLAMDELAFTADEAGELAEQLGTALPMAALSELIAATEGWAMGVHLLLKSGVRAKGLSQADEMLRAYVDKELLGPLGSIEREVLLKACLVDLMDDALVSSFIDVPDAHTVLRDLARRNGFLIAMSPDGQGLRCPALIRDLLRESARAALGPLALARLAARAADALAIRGRTREAFEILSSSGATAELPVFVAAHGGALLQTGRAETLRQWLSALDAEAFEASPRLHLWRGICRSYLEPRAALDDIALAYRRFRAANDTTGAFEAAVAAVESGLAQIHDLPALDPWIDALAETIDAAQTDADRLRAWYALTYAAHCRKPGQPRLREGIAWIRGHVLRATDPLERLRCGVALIFHACVAADHVLGQEIIDLVAPQLDDQMPSPVTRWLWHYWRGLYHLWRIEYAEATREWDVCVGLCDTHGLKALEHVVLANVVMVDLAEDRLSDARRHLDIIDAAFTGTESMARAFFWLGEMFYRSASKDRAGTREAMDHFVRGARAAGLFSLEMLALTDVAALHLIDGDVEVAEVLAREARARTAGTVARHCDGQISGLEAAIAYLKGNREEARELFSRTLDLIGHKGTCACLLWVRSGLGVLFSEVWQSGERPGLIRELIRLHQIPPPTSFTRPWPWPVEVRAFGSLEIRIDSQLCQPDRKAQHRVLDLLRLLVAEGGQDVRAERIADTLWPDSEGDAAMTNVRGTVKRLRDLLGHPDTVRVFDGKIGLNPRLVWTDVRALRELMETLDATPGGAAVDDDGPSLLFDLYRAPLLESERGDALETARARQRRQFARVVSVLVRRARDRGQEARAADLLERALLRDPEIRGVEGIGPTTVASATEIQRHAS